ncbi:hypothetical protein DICPUDRAFT_81631 [Dictyostelium purpureum]|uniref:BING4 C-terminal domain-containing protein n=1 Tax=Dictyostelium purpureum TaxID=5786 RepID=F0ZU39_DICPU|nr:uncharacterized protein DICPUDRAFT_81631 [Dictyostelium purpureum]EGC32553.1 hypothetical protein DICPUDRAFT_81631 [Dictyostelium purpureum]|eukprot:XP_003290929.1 hypothetical protein DICPUDRAFT_81631 [Dictyostelium purpureum]
MGVQKKDIKKSQQSQPKKQQIKEEEPTIEKDEETLEQQDEKIINKHWKNLNSFNDDSSKPENDSDNDFGDSDDENVNNNRDDDGDGSDEESNNKFGKKRKISEFKNDTNNQEDDEEQDNSNKNGKFDTTIDKTKKVPKGARKYLKGEIVAPTGIKNPYLRTNLKKIGDLKRESAKQALKSEMLLQKDCGFIVTENEKEKTYKLTQHQIAKQVDIQSSGKVFDLNLDPNGPYNFEYSKNGRYLLLAGARGHYSIVDWQRGKKLTERHLGGAIRDACFLHNETMFALAQKKYTYIYNQDGVELHWLKDHYDPKFIDFLPYHYLLVSATNKGKIIYEDISVGQKVVESHYHGPLSAMCQNPQNAVMNLGFSTGIVQMWIPKSRNPVVKIHCHKSPITSMAVSLSGNYLVTAGSDCMVKVFDLRNTYQETHAFATKITPNAISLSGTNVLAVAGDKQTYIWKNPFDTSIQEPYLIHKNNSIANSVQFCPFEDVLGIGTQSGFSSTLVPGSGIANYDSMEADPFASNKMKKEQEVKKLLEKIPHDMITLDPNVIGTIQSGVKSEEDKFKRANEPKVDKNRVFDPVKLQQIKERNKERKEKRESEILTSTDKSALSRFEKKY